MKHKINVRGYELEIEQDEDGKFLIPEKFRGLGTGLKPASEHYILCRKPLSEKSVADNVLKYGTGGINIDKSRIGTDEKLKEQQLVDFRGNGDKMNLGASGLGRTVLEDRSYIPNDQGRFPSNFIHDGGEEVMAEFDKAGKTSQGHWSKTKTTGYGEYGGGKNEYMGVGRKENGGSAARFFYCSKASKKEKNAGLEENKERNIHPTTKPVKLMSYLINMITPPNGIVLDPFLGSGSTGVAAVKNGFHFIGIEMEPEYMEIAKKRIDYENKRNTII